MARARECGARNAYTRTAQALGVVREDQGVVAFERRPGRSLGRGRGVGRDVEPLPRGPAEVLGARGVVDDRVVRGRGADQSGGEEVGAHREKGSLNVVGLSK